MIVRNQFWHDTNIELFKTSKLIVRLISYSKPITFLRNQHHNVPKVPWTAVQIGLYFTIDFTLQSAYDSKLLTFRALRTQPCEQSGIRCHSFCSMHSPDASSWYRSNQYPYQTFLSRFVSINLRANKNRKDFVEALQVSFTVEFFLCVVMNSFWT